ncbi:Chromosome segregation ATPase [Geosmithia morbida]|uniref:Chromosome segregation ATPase n=1 Tax=Geosmithia morbida TaxID=1094350 RepID=A0A9P4YQ72_9HYPO|nr:Chromosome segregation ATPase [Geosmithia morbida]KAF4121101.1 Chromosome segregation ATPase [Geosmithia morbida]
MTSPLSSSASAALNSSTSKKRRSEEYEVEAFTTMSSRDIHNSDESDSSSPFVSYVNNNNNNNTTTTANNNNNNNNNNEEEESAPASFAAAAPTMTSNGNGNDHPERTNGAATARKMGLDQAVRENHGLRHAIEIFEDEDSIMERHQHTVEKQHQQQGRQDMDGQEEEEERGGPDDTMVSTFSTFSAVPDMTMLAKLSSPVKEGEDFRRSSSRTKGGGSTRESAGNLLDFTEQLRNSSPMRSPAKGSATPSGGAAGSRRVSNLIDFDIPPMPTPRSVPTISARELESLKSSFLSEISSLRASLSGKEAEVTSLKEAVGDAEKRVSASLQLLREEQLAREGLEASRRDWEARGREMEALLGKAREEIVTGEVERERLEMKLDESVKRREAAEMLHQEAESKMAGMRAGRDSASASASHQHQHHQQKALPNPEATNREVEVAVERVARELHGLYKSKHETKVTALKKSYESRWQKKVNELEARIENLTVENERIRADLSAASEKSTSAPSMANSGSAASDEKIRAQAVRDSASVKELTADVQRLEAILCTVQRDNDHLRSMLETERVEKGELVQLAEEMMSMQQQQVVEQQQQQQQQQQQPPTPQRQRQQQHQQYQHQHPDAPAAKTPKRSHTATAGANRASGLRAPGSAIRPPMGSRTPGGGLPRPGVARSGIMSSIEKMGNYRGRGGD